MCSSILKGGGLVSLMLSRVPINMAASPLPSPCPRRFCKQKKVFARLVTLRGRGRGRQTKKIVNVRWKIRESCSYVALLLGLHSLQYFAVFKYRGEGLARARLRITCDDIR